MLKIKIRQTIQTDKNNNVYYLAAGNPQALKKVYGALPALRQWATYDGKPVIYGRYTDVTSSVDDLHKLTLTYTHRYDNDGIITPGVANQRSAVSNAVTFEGDAYKLIKSWLIDDISAPLNTIDVQIEHVGCGKYDNWSISAKELTWCNGVGDEACYFDITLKQKEDSMSCIKSTLITDNWQEWFPEDGRPVNKKHPRFSYCNEVKPNGILITLWWMIVNLQTALVPLIFSLALAINPIIAIIKGIIAVINAIVSIVGGNGITDNLDYIDLKDIKDLFGNFYVESAGCGREHPAPLIRDYISNVCSKCGVTVNDQTAAIFYAQTIEIETSIDRQNKTGKQWRWNPHYNACYFNGVSQRGIRRLENLNIFTGGQANLSDYWIYDNGPLLTLDKFLDQLMPVYNGRWRIENNTLYIQRKDYWLNDTPAFDFTGEDKNLLISSICYEWDENLSPAIIRGIYTKDGADTCGNEAQGQQDGIIDLGVTEENPNMEGVLDKTTQFGAAKFRLDGASTDYVYDAMEQVIAGTTLTGQVWSTPTFQTVSKYFKDYADYGLLLTDEASTLPKILIWDGASFENAKCVKTMAAHPAAGPTPSPNLRYNNYQGVTPWEIKHVPKTKVLGRRLFSPPARVGFYDVKGVLGANVVQQPAMLVNYPMYFEPGYEGTLWDWFHYIDDPLFNPVLHQNFSFKLDLCCETLKRINPFNDARNIILGQKVKLPIKFYSDGNITEINIIYDTENKDGMHIEIKGKL